MNVVGDIVQNMHRSFKIACRYLPKVKISITSKISDISDIHGSNALNDARRNPKSIGMIV